MSLMEDTLGQILNTSDTSLTSSSVAFSSAPAALRLFVDDSAFVMSNILNKNSRSEERRLCGRYEMQRNQIRDLDRVCNFVRVIFITKITRKQLL
jgi:hypothetical protein